ncbi:MAG: amino acid adenylation domain-containing protein, partial [bacterium]|nr:amino acid adenylation domain-containing protein [bacterium]
ARGGPPGRLLHVYGPTESTTYTSWHPVTAVAPGARTVPIGGPLSNTEIYVLDRHLVPVPAGVPGELCVGGDGLARGYLFRPGLTAEKFIPDPFRSTLSRGERLYRTGDLVRTLAHGSVEFLGRLDHQVKLRGFRIELGEIEAVLAAHPAVVETVLVAAGADQGVGGVKRLVAYVVPETGNLDAGELRAFLGDSLPEFMVPAAFVLLESLPRTPNGKVDRRALPAPESVAWAQAEDWVAPRGPLEEVVAGIWAQLLGVDRVGAHDDFFELGGHSLLATQVLSRVRQQLGVELPLRVLFEQSTVAGMTAGIAAIQHREQGLEAPPIRPAPRRGDPPLSFAQQRLWFLERFEPDTAQYNIANLLHFRGALDEAALAGALGEIVRRHEVLRTTYGIVNGEPVQRIGPAVALRLPRVDLRSLTPAERSLEVDRVARDEAREPFDLGRGPLLRAYLLRLAPDQHALCMSVHHIAFDGWSERVFLRELAIFYRALTADRGAAVVPSPLPELPIQYADFAVWQRQWLQGEVLERSLAYWRQHLESLPVLELPTDRPRPAFRSSRGAVESFRLPSVLTRELHELSRHRDVTLFMILVAVFQAQLRRYTGQQDLAVGTVIANRNRAEIEALVGFFVNTLVLRCHLAGDPPFDELLALVREVALGAYAHQDVPFEQLVGALDPQRNLSQNPLVQVLLVLQETPLTTAELVPGLALEGREVHGGEAKFDLTLSLAEIDGRLDGRLEYCTALFDPTTARRLIDHFRTLVEAVAAAPASKLGELPLLSAAQRHQLLAEWNVAAAAWTDGGCPVHEQIARRAVQQGEAVAVAWGRRRLSYRELNDRSDRLAHRLRALGVGRGVRVGLGQEASPEFVVGLLAVLKAGGVYVPLDPHYPQERREYLLRDAGIAVLLTDEQAPAAGVRVVSITREPGAAGPCPPARPAVVLDDPAYVIYTSGSTGTPKGSGVYHRGVANLVRWYIDEYDLTAGDRFLIISSVNFDLTQKNLLAPLVLGGELHFPYAERFDADVIRDTVRDAGITIVNCTPTALYAVLEGGDEDEPPLASLRVALLGGEPIAVQRLLHAAERSGMRGEIVNMYGPTECTDISAACRLVPLGRFAAAPVPIGRPPANVRMWVLDPFLVPCPIGAPGDLWVGGESVGGGYLNRPRMSAERFCPDPFSGAAGGRIYYTGDRGRYQTDGHFEFLGRRDHQVKLRGFRIEPGEIETVLAAHPAVREAVVLVREDRPGDPRLVAYFTGSGARTPGSEARTSELRDHLREKLPDYMVPSVFVALAELPLTPNRKVDRRALPAPGRDDDPGGGRSSARTPTEELLAAIWCQILGVRQVGVDDGFFELGGHSLLATQLISRIRDAFGTELPLGKVFEEPTLGCLAAVIDDGRRPVRMPPIAPAPRDQRLALSFAQQRLWFIDRYEPGSALYNVPTALRLGGRLELAALAGALNEIVRRHEVLRTVFATADGEPYQVIRPALDLPLPLIDLTRLPEPERRTEADRLVADEARQPFDLARGPVARAGLVRLAAEHHLLLLTVHHIAFDGWSVGVFLRELAVLYTGPYPLPELPIQYADFAVWQRQWLRGEALERQMTYWREQLAGLPVLELPADRPRPAVQTFRGASDDWRLPDELHQGLEALGRELGSTLFMTLLAAFQLLLGRTTGQQDLAVGSPIANRNRSEIEGLLGFFINTLALRADLSGNPTFRQLVTRVRDAALAAYAHQDLPFEKLVEELDPERDLSQNPLVQVLFVLQNTSTAAWELGPGVAVEPLQVIPGGAKFDLTLGLQEGEEGLFGGFEYNCDLFDAVTIRRLGGHFRTLLAGLVTAPERRLSELPLISVVETQQLLWEWNDTASSPRPAATLHQLLEVQAAATPDATAVVCGGQRLTYRELDQEANRLAHLLRALGVGPEQLVGICSERSAALVVAVFGVLKAGGAYLPLDPGYPEERLAFMLDDAAARVILTQERLVAELPEHRARVVCLDRDRPLVAAESAAAPPAAAVPENLAYLIYTSGSTGRAKGVAIEHRSAAGMVRWAATVFGDDELAGALASTSVCFDLSIYELFLPLSRGGTVIMAHSALDLEALRGDPPVTLINTVPSAMRELVRIGGLPESVRTVNLAGEALPRELVDDVYREGVERVLNLYGPSEDTTYSTFAVIRREAAPPPIGRPVADTRFYLLDRRLQPVPMGVPGELYLAGAGLARGYLGRPELTAERWLPDPWSAAGGERFYRTGDLARTLPDGELAFLGRLDHQVKLRGFRIELGEIEVMLRLHPGVREGIVVVRDERLVAWVVRAAGDELDAEALRAFAGERLPAYMVPAVVIFLDAMPLTPNGKVDRAALGSRPLPAADRIGGEEDFPAPRTPLEQLLAEVWSEVLGVDRVGRGDNFFALGGHSLLATKVFARLNESLAIELPLPLIFDAPNLDELAARLAELVSRRQGGPELVGLVEMEPRDPDLTHLPLSFSQERLWVLDRLEPGSSAYNIPFPARLRGEVAVPVLDRSLGEIVRRHQSLRTTFTTRDGEPVQVVDGSESRAFPLPLIDLTHLAEESREAEARARAAADAATGFDLSRGPLYRAALLLLGPGDYVLLQNMHHVISDGWSIGIMLRELAALLKACGAGRPPALPELPIQYPDFALWQRRRLGGELLERQLGYWRRQLGGVLPTLELPGDRPRPAVQSHRGASVRRRLPAALRDSLAALAQGHGASLFMVLLAAFKVLLYRFTGQEDLIVGSPIAGRGRLETEGLVGFFLNTLALRTEVTGELRFRDLLDRV